MVRYLCPGCDRRFRGRGRPPGGRVYCPRCGALAYTYRKAVRPMDDVVKELK